MKLEKSMNVRRKGVFRSSDTGLDATVETGAAGYATDAGPGTAPTGLLTNLLRFPNNTALTDATPKFGWIVNAAGNGASQSAYRILSPRGFDEQATSIRRALTQEFRG